MPPLSPVTAAVREVLAADLTLTADEVIREAKSRGLKAPDSAIRIAVHNQRSEMRKKAAKDAAAHAANGSPGPAAAPARKAAAPARPTGPAPATLPADLGAVLSNATLVGRLVGQVGAEHARQAAEAVRACGGVDTFLQYLELVAGLRTSDHAG